MTPEQRRAAIKANIDRQLALAKERAKESADRPMRKETFAPRIPKPVPGGTKP